MWDFNQAFVIWGSVLGALVFVSFICTSNLSLLAASALFSLDAVGPASCVNLVYH
jgi:hypothetical protein